VGKGTIWAILRSPVYIGRTVYAKARYSEIGKKKGKVQRAEADRIVVEGAVPTIVPRELWDAAQARHGTRKFGVGRPWHRPYLLSGLIGSRRRTSMTPWSTASRSGSSEYSIPNAYGVRSASSFCPRARPRIRSTIWTRASLRRGPR